MTVQPMLMVRTWADQRGGNEVALSSGYKSRLRLGPKEQRYFGRKEASWLCC